MDSEPTLITQVDQRTGSLKPQKTFRFFKDINMCFLNFIQVFQKAKLKLLQQNSTSISNLALIILSP